MTDNPYAPPSARVDDVSAATPRERPPQIKRVIQLAVINYVLGLIMMAVTWDFYSKLQSVPALIFNQAFTIAIMFWLYYKIWVGRNWARIVLLVFTILGCVMSAGVFATGFMPAMPAIMKVQMAVGIVVSFVVIWMLFTSPGKDWFRPRSE
jgi:uncharacterized protein involved in response to NO